MRSSLPMRKGFAQASDCTPDFISPTKPVFCETIWARRKDRYQNQSTPQDWTSFTGKRSSTFSSPPVGFLLTDPSTSFKEVPNALLLGLYCTLIEVVIQQFKKLSLTTWNPAEFSNFCCFDDLSPWKGWKLSLTKMIFALLDIFSNCNPKSYAV